MFVVDILLKKIYMEVGILFFLLFLRHNWYGTATGCTQHTILRSVINKSRIEKSVGRRSLSMTAALATRPTLPLPSPLKKKIIHDFLRQDRLRPSDACRQSFSS